MQDYYQILGLSPNATSGQIRLAYRRLALKYHPDRNQKDQTSSKRFIEIVEAYDVLSNPESRNRYDLGFRPGSETQQQTNTRRHRPPPPHFYRTIEQSKPKYSRRDYVFATIIMVGIVTAAVVFPMYLLQTTSDRYFDLAVSNYYAGNYYSALHNIDLSIRETSSNNSEACALASIILVHRLKKYDFAYRYIERGLSYGPGDSLLSEFHYLKGICEVKKARPEAALAEFALVEAYSPNYDSSLFRSAAVLIFNQSRLDTARLLIDELLLRNDQNHHARYLRGIIYEKRSQHQEAYDTFASLLGQPFNQAATYYHLAKAEIALDQKDSACAHLQIAANFNLVEAGQLMKLVCEKKTIFLSPYN
jgi:curved DNA-binding protein CbpA